MNRKIVVITAVLLMCTLLIGIVPVMADEAKRRLILKHGIQS